MNKTDKRLRILLVEDSKIIASQIVDLLEQNVSCPISVTVTATEKEAIRAAGQFSPDIVILDLHLKQGTGFGVLKALTSVEQVPTVAVLTNYALPKYRDLALQSGAHYFLDKAHDFENLPGIIELISRAAEPPAPAMH